MLNVKSTHIGSLPGHDLNWAMDLTFSYDIPCLFTLPQLDSNQFMLESIFFALEIAEKKEDGFYLKDDFNKETSAEINIFFLDEFCKRHKSKKTPFIKYQLPSPITLFESLKNKSDFSFSLFCSFLVLKYQACLQKLIDSFPMAGVIFFLDDPILSYVDYDLFEDSNNEFYRNLRNALREKDCLGIHCCGEFSEHHVLEKLPNIDYLSLDTKFYLDDIEKLPIINSLGLGTDFSSQKILAMVKKCSNSNMKFSKNNLVKTANKTNPLLLTPSCGGALSSLKHCEDILNKIKNIQSCLKS